MSSAGYPGSFPGGLTTGFRVIGASQKVVTGTSGYPASFPGGLTTGNYDIGAVQKNVVTNTTVTYLLFF